MKRITVIILIAALLLSLSTAAWAKRPAVIWDGPVARIVDGDTLDIYRGDEVVRIRLACIDAPETTGTGQPYGREATDELISMVPVKSYVTVEDYGTGRYGRRICVIITTKGLDVNRELVVRGAAWSRCRDLDAAQERARARGLGLWADPNPIDPYDWRKGERKKR